MDPCSLHQLDTILHNYKSDSTLVYNRSKNLFYSVATPSGLDPNEYDIQSDDVNDKINQFIQKNSPFLDKKILREFKDNLENRIKLLDTRTQGFAGILTFLFYLIFPGSKVQFEKQKQSLLAIKSIIEESLDRQAGSNEQQIKKNDVFHPSGESSPTSSDNVHQNGQVSNPLLAALKGKHSLKKMTFDDRENKTKPLPSPLKLRKQPMNNPKSPHFTPSHQQQGSNPTPLPTRSPPSEKTRRNFFAAIKGKSLSTSSLGNSFPADTNQSNQPPRLPSIKPPILINKLTKNEPDPFVLVDEDYRKLSPDEFSNQIAVIENYIQETEIALRPIEELIQECMSEMEEIQKIDSSLIELKKQLEQTKNNLEILERGLQNDEVVSLFFKTSTDSIEIPFYPEKLQEEAQAIENGVGKDVVFFSCLGLVKSNTIFAELVQALEQKIELTEAEKQSAEDTLNTNQEICKRNYSKDWQSLEKTLQQKKKNLKDWAEYYKRCKKLLNSKIREGKTLFLKREEEKEISPEIHLRFPFIEKLKKFQQNVRIPLIKESRDDRKISEIIDNFPSTLYGSLYSEKTPT